MRTDEEHNGDAVQFPRHDHVRTGAFPSASGSAFRQAVSANGIPELPPGSTRIAAPDGWTMTPSGSRGVLNDALSIYLGDGTLANAFAARWCIGARAEATGGVFQVREGEPVSRLGPTMHRRS